ncbi:MAG: extracellular solute-binding protein, partial [Chlamydiia bacterium]|nr:extracellular solute-binding protein [Chlamydiia bacterium]
MKLGKIFIRIAIIAIWICLFFTFLTATQLFSPQKEKEQTLHLFSWPEILSPETIKGFEEETGIKVVRHYYTSNEELLVKLKATEGRGYDLIIPSDYAVKKLVEEDLLLPLDHSKLDFLDHLNPKLTCQPFDEKNTYSLPYIWEFMGFGINQD